ncbi:MAG: hypothetical protein ACI9GW_003173 [Halieaceae bacterium]|jgi:hypothetical protein
MMASLLLPGLAHSCECLWNGPFTQVQGSTDLVVSGEVLSSRGNYIDLGVQRILRGRAFLEDIRIWTKTGELCRPKVDQFPPGSRWLMALDRIEENQPGGFDPNTPNISYGRIGDYSVSSCGGYWLSLTEDLVTGNLAGGTRWEMNPKMTPVIFDLVVSFVEGKVPASVLLEASQEDPLIKQMMLDTRSFIREESYQSN